LELLIVLGIVTAVLALLLPAVLKARARANAVRCASNVRQICIGLIMYAGDHQGHFPPNVSAHDRFWCDNDRIIKYLSVPGSAPPVFGCPEDEGGVRSYAMNIWASSTIDRDLLRDPNRCGEPWRSPVSQQGRMILVAESWAVYGGDEIGWTASEAIGFAGLTPGRRFGGGAGLVPMIETRRYGPLSCELAYERHRLRGDGGSGTEPRGRVNIGYADGHVAMKAHDQLVAPRTGRSTFDSWWCEVDDQLEP
jgi:prepilin-type processing-associated H-X9-DG protein